MGTPERFHVYIGTVLIASAWTIQSAHKKLDTAIIAYSGTYPAIAYIIKSTGYVVYQEELQDFSNLILISEDIK